MSGDETTIAELRRRNLIAPDGRILSKPYAPEWNPFRPGSENMTEQGKLIRTDRERARTLILASGAKPSEWGL